MGVFISSGIFERARARGATVGTAVAIEKWMGDLAGSPRLAWRHRRHPMAAGMVAGIPQGAVPADRLPRIFLVPFPIVSQIPQTRLDAFKLPVVQPHATALTAQVHAHTVAVCLAQRIATARTAQETGLSCPQ
jgi:hypothetical protein